MSALEAPHIRCPRFPLLSEGSGGSLCAADRRPAPAHHHHGFDRVAATTMRAFEPCLRDVDPVVGDERDEQCSGVSQVGTGHVGPRAWPCEHDAASCGHAAGPVDDGRWHPSPPVVRRVGELLTNRQQRVADNGSGMGRGQLGTCLPSCDAGVRRAEGGVEKMGPTVDAAQ